MATLIIAPSAQQDLSDIYAYIARDSPSPPLLGEMDREKMHPYLDWYWTFAERRGK